MVSPMEEPEDSAMRTTIEQGVAESEGASSIDLKPHNRQPYEELCEILTTSQRCAYVSATGTGKSYVIAKYIEEHNLLDKTLILVPSIVIRDGWKRLLPGIHVGTYQSLRYDSIDKVSFKLIVCDELHHLGAKKWGRLCKELFARFPGKVVGVSATPVRFLDHSRNMTDELFDGRVVRGMDLPDAIDKGVLPSFDYTSALYNFPELLPKGVEGLKHRSCTEYLVRQLDIIKSQYTFKQILRDQLADGNPHKVAVFVDKIERLEEVCSICESVFPRRRIT